MTLEKNWNQVKLNIFPGPNDTWAVVKEHILRDGGPSIHISGTDIICINKHTGLFKEMMDLYNKYKIELVNGGYRIK